MMIEDQQMGSQTLEILRQGVWASLTGGWFYDPHQDVFCNTFHLYLWLFLLCLPFSIYVYFPPTLYLWYLYCGLITIAFIVIKIVNYTLHRMYDTTECIHEEVNEDWPEQKKESEGIEMQVLSDSTKSVTGSPHIKTCTSLASNAEGIVITDSDSIESEEIQRLDEFNKPNTSTTDLKAEVHRKNSSESSEDVSFQPVIEIVTYHSDASERGPSKSSEHRSKSRKTRGDGFVAITMKDEPKQKTQRQSGDSRKSNLLNQHRPSLQNVESEQNSPKMLRTPRRHSNFANSSLSFLPSSAQNEIKPTGSVELGCIKNEKEGFYFKANNEGGVRRIRSTALEVSCPPPTLTVHPNSLEIIGGKSAKSPLPPPSSTLIRNQHLNLCPYFGSEIVYPIAEQSDEHQTSHGPDSDLDSLNHNSDSECEENHQGSHSPLLVRIQNIDCVKMVHAVRIVPNSEKELRRIHPELKQKCDLNSNFTFSVRRKDERTKDILENDNSNSSATPEMHDARSDFYTTDNEYSDRKLSECSNLSCSNSSVEYEESVLEKGDMSRSCTIKFKPSLADEYQFLDDSKKYLESRNEVLITDFNDTGTVKRKPARRNRKRKSTPKSEETGNRSSLVELDLDWLFDDENDRVKRKSVAESYKTDTERSSTSISLEHDVSKVLQEPVPAARSLGAIPKRIRPSNRHEFREKTCRSTLTKSESERCCRRRHEPQIDKSFFSRNRSMKENKLTQTLQQNENSIEGLECLVDLESQLKKQNLAKKYCSPYNEASSSGSNNELSTLLPAPPLLSAFLVSRRDFPVAVCLPREATKLERSPAQRHCRLKRSTRVHRRGVQESLRGRRNQREVAIASTLSSGHGTHCAKSFDDTSDGSVHCFLDEYGNWVTYTFDQKGLGTANSTLPTNSGTILSTLLKQRELAGNSRNANNNRSSTDIWDSSTDSNCNSSVSALDASAATSNTPPKSVLPVHNVRNSNPIFIRTLEDLNQYLSEPLRLEHNRADLDELLSYPTRFERCGTHSIILGNLEARLRNANAERNRFRIIQTPDTASVNYPRSKSYYKYKVFPWISLRVTLDRLKLLALLDRNLTLSETWLSIFLGILVSVLGASLLHLGFYKDLLAFIFCFVIASCQYSLLKSVQPDAASPTHGFNKIIAYSRPIYFCLFSLIVLMLHSSITNESYHNAFTLYGVHFTNKTILIATRDFLLKFVICFPIVFSFGLFPQVNTFSMYLLEQIDMHIFGGNAMSSLLASVYCVFRSVMAVIVMYGLAYGSLSEPKGSQHILFSMFCACLVSSSYHLSRSASDPSNLWNIVKMHLWSIDTYRENVSKTQKAKIEVKKKVVKPKEEEKSETNKNEDLVDPLPLKLQKTVNARLKSDVLLCGLIALMVFGIHASTVFTALQPELGPVLWCGAALVGFLLHYVFPQMRKQLPWLCIARPVFRSQEYDQYQVRGPARIMWFERVYVYLCFLERNIIYPLLFLAILTEDSPKIVQKFGALGGALVVVVCAMRSMRGSYSQPSSQYLIVIFTVLFFKYDYKMAQESFLIDYFLISFIYYKVCEFMLKLQFVVTYIAPWQITWGSAFHAFAQPFSVPHSAMLFLQAFISAVLSTPLNPFLGSAIFLTSYVRPIKFWERDYNTRRVDHSNTPLSSHLDRNLGADDNNLNSIFYEHLTRSLQHSLCGDLVLGRWGPVSQGDCFVLASDYLNCLVHIIEVGNGLVTFQMRGLEFRGTYCQQREVEAITEGVEENDGCCCCDPGHLPNMLSVNAAFSQRWLAWEVTAAKYVLEGYSISDNSAVSMLQVFDFRKVLITYYVKSIIFYTIRSPKLEDWLNSQTILKALQPIRDRNFVDLDPIFNFNIDEDYDVNSCGMTCNMFHHIYGDWIGYCAERWEKNIPTSVGSALVILCFALSLLGRRSLGAVSHNTVSSVEFFLYGLHALFKGDFRITCSRDEWVFTDMDLLKTIVAPGVRMSLKLHQDHFMSPDEYEEMAALFDAICKHEEELVISHEGDPAWRNAVLSGTPSLLALRHVLDDGADEYKIIMLNKRYLSFRVIKINRECVRGLWAGQQQELVYLRNRNPERGSIQNAKQALRNIINSSCDQPIGYPIYVSPLTTSYAETNEQLCSVIGGSVSLGKIRNYVVGLFGRIRKRCREGCSSGASRDEMGMGQEGVYAMTPMAVLNHHTAGSQDGSHLGGSMGRGASLSRTSLGGNRGSLASMGKPTSSTLASLAGLFKERDERAVSQVPDGQTRMDEPTEQLEKEFTFHRVRIIDPNLVYDCINLGRRIDVSWPDENMRARGGRSHWRDWLPETGMEGQVVHRWSPCHRDPSRRSHVDRTILLVKIDDKYVPIAESGVQDLGAEV